jgi:adenine-specific DNA methylase
MSTIQMNDEFRKKFIDINRKATKLIRDEVEKLSDDARERIMLAHTIINFMYESDKVAISSLGLTVKPVFNEE